MLMIAATMAATAALSLSSAAPSDGIDGWRKFSAGNQCLYKQVEEPESWFHATRHCNDDEHKSDVARVLSAPEAQFVAGLSESKVSRWVLNYVEDGEWSVDWASLNLWQAGQPGNIAATYKLCAAQGHAEDAVRFRAEYCSNKLPFVCKLCPNEEADDLVVLPKSLPAVNVVPAVAKTEDVAVVAQEEAVAEVREVRDVGVTSTTTTTEAPDGNIAEDEEDSTPGESAVSSAGCYDDCGCPPSIEAAGTDKAFMMCNSACFNDCIGTDSSLSVKCGQEAYTFTMKCFPTLVGQGPPDATEEDNVDDAGGNQVGAGMGVQAAMAQIAIVDASAAAGGASASSAQTVTIAAASVATVIMLAVVGVVVKFKASAKHAHAAVPSSGHQGAINLSWDDEMEEVRHI